MLRAIEREDSSVWRFYLPDKIPPIRFNQPIGLPVLIAYTFS